MTNLEQVRAAHAINLAHPKGANGEPLQPGFTRNDIAKLPALILTNGLLAATAYACEDGKPTRRGMKRAMDNGVCDHLGYNDGADLIEKLSSQRAGVTEALQRDTSEALAYLGYLKRFAPPKKQTTDSAARAHHE